MKESKLIVAWNELRKVLVFSQLISVLVLVVVLYLLVAQDLAGAADEVKLFALAVVGTTGVLSLVSQFAVIREAQSMAKDLRGSKSDTGSLISVSYGYLRLTQFVMAAFGVGVFGLLVWALY